MKAFLEQTRKAAGVAIAGVYGWATLVVSSEPAHITGPEWLALGGVGVAVAACYGLTNEKPLPAQGGPQNEDEARAQGLL